MPNEMHEEDFAQSIYAKHQAHFDHYHRLQMFSQECLTKYRGFTKDAYYAAVQLILPRAHKSFDAIRRLCLLASCEDAAVVLRCLLNLMAVTRWLSVDPQKRAGRFLAWYWVELHRLAEKDPTIFPPHWLPVIENKFAAVKSAFEHKDAKGKVKIVKHWYQPEANGLIDLFRQVDLEKHYDEAYRPLSGTEHSDVMAYFAMFANAKKTNGETQLEIQSDSFACTYLRNGFQYFGDIFVICNKTMALADPAKLEEIINAGIEFYRADMQAKGIKP